MSYADIFDGVRESGEGCAEIIDELVAEGWRHMAHHLGMVRLCKSCKNWPHGESA